MSVRRVVSAAVLAVACQVLGAQAAARVVLYPGAARVAGANGTAWRSQAVFHNPTATAQTVQLELLPRGSAAVAATAPLALAVGETRQIDNLFDFLGAADGAGMLRVTGDAVAWVRTYNQGAAGSFGQDLAGVEPGGGYAPGETVLFPFAATADIASGFRSNILLVNLDDAAIIVTLRTGATEKTTTVAAGAYGQIDNLGAFLGSPPGFSVVRVAADGRWFAVVSTVDPGTGDPTTARGLGAGETGERRFPGVARLAGANGTAWRSEAILHNPADAPVEVSLALIPRGESEAAATATIALAAGETRRLTDVYTTLGVASGAGALRVGGGALAWVRTFNQGVQGTFGQDLPPSTAPLGVSAAIPVALPFRSAASIQTDFRSNLVVQNLEERDITLSILAGATEKTQLVKALSYVQIDNLGAVLGVPPGSSTAWVQADGRWAGAVSTIDPFTGDPTTLRDDRAYQPPTSYQLIDGALAAQTVSNEQAVAYKVFADFGDPRLPASLRGDDRNVAEGEGASEAAAQFAGLSPATQELVGPFLAQPFYEGSWWDLRRAGGTGARAAASACRPWTITCPILTGDWAYHDGTHVRVWYLKSHAATDAAVAVDLASAAAADVWPKFATTMGRVPKPDGGEGGNALLDVVLSDGLGAGKHGLTLATGVFACKDSPAYTLINRTISDPAKRRSILAHELFHAVQFAVPSQQCLASMKWLGEGTATWFEDVVYQGVNREHVAAAYYLNRTHVALDNDLGVAGKNYGAYLFFLYLTRIRGVSPSVVGQIWNATASADAVHALDTALRTAGAELDLSWPDFAAYAWNREAPFDFLAAQDSLADAATVEGPRSGSLGGPSASWELIPKGEPPLPRLSIRYFHYDFPDATVSSLGFFNGLTRSLETHLAEDYGDAYSSRALTGPDTAQGGHVTALVKINGTWKQEDWTSLAYRLYCRDLKAERVESLVVILSNSSIEEISSVWPKGDHPPLLFASNIGCAAWQGSANLTLKWGDAVVETMTVTDLRLAPISDGLYDEDTPLFRAYVPTAGGFTYAAGGHDQGCAYTAGYASSTTSPLSAFHSLPWVVRGVGYRGTITLLFWEWLMQLQVLGYTCPSDSGTTYWNASSFFLASIPESGWVRFAPDGKRLTVNAASIPDHPGLSGTWTFTHVREP